MRKFIFVMIITMLITGMVSAQPRGAWGDIPQTTVEGTLRLHNGQIVVSTGDAIVYVPGLRRHAGFIDGIKEGAHVSVSGFARGDVLHPLRLTVDGRTHELAMNTRAGRSRDFGPGPGFSGWQCCRDFNRPGHRHHGGRGRHGW
jgi:hypothetical protein